MNGYVNVAIDLSKLLSTVENSATNAIKEERTLYALTVEGEHEYFADGILVHNCVASLWIFAGTLKSTDLLERKRSGFAIL